MATAAQLRLNQGTDETIDLDPIWRNGQRYDLTTVTLTAYIKPASDTPDDDPSVKVITQTAGPNGVINVTDAANGVAEMIVDGSVIPEPGTLAWRLDAADQTGAVGRVTYGPVYVEADGSD